MNNERGITLVELLATIVIFTIVGVLVTSITVQSLGNQKQIEKEIFLRDEAELLLANAVKGIYTTLESDILSVEGNQMKISVAESSVSPLADRQLTACEHGKCTVITGFVPNGDDVDFYIESVKFEPSSPDVKISVLSTLEEMAHSNTEDADDDQIGEIATYKIHLGLFHQSDKNEKIYWFENEITSINNL